MFITEVVANNVQFLEPKNTNSNQQSSKQANAFDNNDIDDRDLPF